MDRRRGVSLRPASSEELECWSQTSTSLKNLTEIYSNPATTELVNRVNRVIAAWPTDDTLPADGMEGMRTIHKKLSLGLHEIKNTTEKEVQLIDNAIESLGILIALRKASEAIPLQQDKRIKRPRAHSPANSVAPPPTPAPGPVGRGSVSITLPPRPGVHVPFSRDPKSRREALAKQLPLQEGRKVAFHPPVNSKPGEVETGPDENTWILAVITKCINQDKNRYEVQDAEPQEDGQPGQLYNTTLRAIIPLPDPTALPGTPAHISAYHEYSTGSTVMALYPDTSCFYRAVVIASPKEVQPGARGPKQVPMYKLKFDDDDDQEHTVSSLWVVEWPGQS